MDLGFIMVRCQRCRLIHSVANKFWNERKDVLFCDVDNCGGDLKRQRHLEERIILNCGEMVLPVHKPEAAPAPMEKPDVWELVWKGMKARKLVAGDPLRAAYEAALEQAVFLRQALLERDGK